MIARLCRLALLAVASLASSWVGAQAPILPSFESRTGYPLPQAGAYFDPAQSGVGLLLDVGLDGSVFGALAVYDTDGEPTFYTLQGAIDRGRLGGGSTAIGVLRSPLYRSRDGQCLGCSWQPPVTAVDSRHGIAEALFTEGRRLELRVGGSVWRMQRMDIDYSLEQLLADSWLLALDERRADGSAVSVQARVRIAPTPAASVRVDGPAACGAAPPAGTPLFELSCESDCMAFDTWAPRGTRRVLAWRNPDSSTFQLAHVQRMGDGFVAPAGLERRTLDLDAFVLRARPNTAQCGGDGVRTTLRLYRDPVNSSTTLTLPRQPGPVYARPVADRFLATAGVYFNPAQPGTGIILDRGPRGTVFAFWFGYGQDGRPTFRTLQGAVERVEELLIGGPFPVVIVNEGVGVRGALLKSTGGARIGAPWQPNTVQADPASGNAVFSSPTSWGRELNLYAGGMVQRQSRMALDRGDADFLVDRWLLVSDNRFAYEDGRIFPTPTLVGTETRAVVEIEALGSDVAVRGSFLAAPLPGDRVYRLRCTEQCAGFAALTGVNVRAEVPLTGVEAFLVVQPRERVGNSGDFVPPASSFPVASLVLASACGSQWCTYRYAPLWQRFSILNRDHLQGRATAPSCSLPAGCPWVSQQGNLRLLRFPRDLH